MTGLLDSPIPSVDDESVARLVRDHFGLSGTITRMRGERDLNARVDTDRGRYSVKIANPGESLPALEMQAMALEHIARVDPLLPVPRPIATVGGDRVAVATIDGIEHLIMAVTFLDGRLAEEDDPVNPDLARSMGAALARLQLALRGFGHGASIRHILWDARLAAELRPWIRHVEPGSDRVLVTSVFDRFDAAAVLAPLPAQVVHNDFHTANLLVSPDGGAEITGIVDFGDMIHGARSQDLATAIAYSLFENGDVAEPAVAMVGSFCEVGRLDRDEVEALPQLVAVRLAQSITIGARRAGVHPENADYILTDARRGREALRGWLDEDPAAMLASLLDAAGHPRRPRETPALSAARASAVHPGLTLSYDVPIHAVHAHGVWIEDADGTRYLDAYNNVPQVGHGNRRVAAAVVNQMTALNTNTRYLTDRVVECAEQLTGLLPEPLDTCLFVNSGSEANDLALRIARTVTGNRGVVISEHAYHGWTEALMAVSPEEAGDRAIPGDVATMSPPGVDEPRGAVEAVRSMAAAGVAPAALLLDTMFSSDGIHVPTAGYLDDAAAIVRDAGGLYVADEVQAGLGRVGRRMWGFATGAAIPDIITLGKPIGNGFPVGVVVTSHEIASRFAAAGYFFSTFGGNTVAAAAAATVVAITIEHDLAGRAEALGARLRASLLDVLHRSGRDGAVRGAGLFIGVELEDDTTATAVAEGMKRRRVLTGTTGRRGEVLKIRPPLVFGDDHAAMLVEAFSETLAEL